MSVNKAKVEAGQAVYTKNVLSTYDIIVLGISNRYIWQCPTSKLEEHYNKYLTSNHLDVGVGTGHFLDRCRFPAAKPRVALMDLNANTLEFASNRIRRYAPETYQENILEPITTDMPKFGSVGINYLLHCLPGSITTKSVALDHLKPLMNPGAVIFGSTILQGGVTRSGMAKWLMNLYNKKGIFSNTLDDVEGLENALKKRFQDVRLAIVGCVALFSGRC